MYEALRNCDLKTRLLQEIDSCSNSDGVDASRLVAQPLLQSTYAEVLRLRVANGMMRQCEFEAFNLDGYQIPKGEEMIIFTRHPALHEESWNLAGRSATMATNLEHFQAERFLVPKGSLNKREGDGKADHPYLDGGEYEFSLEGLAGLWLPYGGGQRMCPGRHFAKAEIITTVASLISQYDLELIDADKLHAKPDMRWFPTGGLPPDCRVPFRMRRGFRAANK